MEQYFQESKISRERQHILLALLIYLEKSDVLSGSQTRHVTLLENVLYLL